MVNEFEEFRKSYDGTYIRILFEKGTNYVPVLILGGILNNEGEWIKCITRKYGESLVKYRGSKSQFDFQFPPIGLFNYNNDMHYFYRFPERQYKKGISARNSIIRNLIGPFRTQYIPSEITTLNVITLEAVFSGNFPANLSEGLIRLSEVSSIALNRNFGLSLSPSNDNPYPQLWKGFQMIGYVDPNKKTIFVISNILQQEVTDYIKRTRQPWQIV